MNTPTWAAEDLIRTLSIGHDRGGHLLIPPERLLIAAILRLPVAVVQGYARLLKRRSPIQRARSCDSLGAMLQQGLVSDDVQMCEQLHESTVVELRVFLRAHGQRARSTTRRPRLLAAALQLPAQVYRPNNWVRIQHRLLMERLHRFVALRPFPDQDNPLLQRLEIRSWPDYQPTTGRSLWASRDHLLGWEHSLGLLQTGDPVALVEALADPHSNAPGQLDLRPAIRRSLLDLARPLESSNPELAAQIYTKLIEGPSNRHAIRARLRLAMLHAQQDRPERGLTLLRQARDLQGPARLSIHRTGRRLARTCRQGWAPDRPAPTLQRRRLALAPAPSPGLRPLFGEGVPVEPATIEALAQIGRTALHAEGSLWRHLFALLFAPHCYFLPVPGALPGPWLRGPLDLGTPGFAAHRPGAIVATRQAILQGRAAALVDETHRQFSGTCLAGARWDRSVEADRALVEAIGPTMLLVILDRLLEHGLRRARGLPDLLILPGPPAELPDAHPRRLPPCLVLAELKTPNDSLSDAQRWWLAELHNVARVEVWQVHPKRHTQQR